eukprot:scaffold314962_cov40-Prasinocladus_malaysianus.AAC.2
MGWVLALCRDHLIELRISSSCCTLADCDAPVMGASAPSAAAAAPFPLALSGQVAPAFVRAAGLCRKRSFVSVREHTRHACLDSHDGEVISVVMQVRQ